MSSTSTPTPTPRSLFSLLSYCLVALLALSYVPLVSTEVIGIDFGSNWFKVASLRTNQDPNGRAGKEIDLVLNRESKRKTHSFITIRTGERFFGSDSVALGPRFPSTTFPHLKSLLGKLANSTDAQIYSSLFPVKLSADPNRGTVVLEGMSDDKYSVEELVGMLLSHAKSQAEQTLKKSITDTVITIPPFFNQAERQAMLASTKLAGLRVLGLLHDETAVAINYAMTRQFPEPQHHIFYDMGAGSTVASLVKFETERRTIKITVIAVGYDKTLGGLTLDAMIAERLAAAFTDANKEKLSTPLKSNQRACVKLLREAARVKEILSVNSNVQAYIEELHEERNLRVILNRTELEEMIASLNSRVIAPLRSVLAPIPSEQIESLVLVGGGVRVPQIQRWLEAEIGTIKIAKNVNGDEAAVMGATWRAVVLARSFRVQKDIQVQDGLPYTITIGSKKPASLFPVLAPMVSYTPTSLGVAKTVTIKKKEPLDLPIVVGESGYLIATLFTKSSNDSVVDQKLTFQLDPLGLLSLTNSTATVVVPGSNGLLGIGKTEDLSELIELEASLVEAIPSLSTEAFNASKSVLEKWDEIEKLSRARENERNAIQSLVYSARDQVTELIMEKVATQDELNEVAQASRETGTWLDDAEEEELTLDVLKSKREALAAKVENVVGRLNKVRKLLAQIRSNVKELKETSKWADEYEARDKYDLPEIEEHAKDIDTRVKEKRQKEMEEKLKKLAEQRKAEEEERRKRETEEMLRKAAEEMAAKKAKAEAESNTTPASEPSPADQKQDSQEEAPENASTPPTPIDDPVESPDQSHEEL